LDKYKPDLLVAAGDLTHFLNWRTCLSMIDPGQGMIGKTVVVNCAMGESKGAVIDLKKRGRSQCKYLASR